YERSGSIRSMATSQPFTRRRSFWATYRQRGYFFREAAMLTITLGFCLHLYRVIFGDQRTLPVMTPAPDKVLLVPMTYAAVTGILLWHRVTFANAPHRIFFTMSLVYIAGSVPLHVYFGVIRGNVHFYLDLFPFYIALLTMFGRLHYRN